MNKPTEAEMKACAASMGLDWGKIDWAKMLTILSTILALFNKQPVQATQAGEAGAEAASDAEFKAAVQHCLSVAEKKANPK